jgi:hypothetical protein
VTSRELARLAKLASGRAWARAAISIAAAKGVVRISIAIVIGPTPPGTGVIAPARALT